MPDERATFATRGLEVYFQSRRAGWDAGLVAHLVQFIEATGTSLDCAIYDLRHPEVLAALGRVAARGKRLRIAYDASKERTGGLGGDPKAGATEDALEAAGLLGHSAPIHEGGRHLMHDKFLVRDGHEVWSGSANFTTGGLELQDNNCFAVASPELAATYTQVFEGLLNHHEHEQHGHAAAAPAQVGAATITPAFAPQAGEGIEDTVIAALKGARRVRVLAFLISDPGILAALGAFRDDPAADIRGVYDPQGMADVLRYSRQDASAFWFLHDPRFVAAPSHAFDPGREQDFMHNKVLIIDDRLVIAGSYNFSENAEANDENLVVIESPEVAAAYTAYFDALHAAYAGAARTEAPAGVRQGRARLQEERQVADVERGLRAHVLRLRSRDGIGLDELSFARARGQFRGETEAGRTAHLVVYTDGSPEGNASAQAVLASGEADYAAVAEWFGGIQLPRGKDGDDQSVPRTATPVRVLMDPQAGGAYHFGCNATDLYIEPSPQLASGFMVAELVEVFEAAAANGWDCGRTNGEGLSRVLAGERGPGLLADLAQTFQAWWANGRADYVNDNSATDQDENGNGCGTLFLYYLHSQLGFTWRQIAAAGGRTLGDCYRKLTGRDPKEGFNDFVAKVATLDRGGQLALPQGGDPFPIGAVGEQPAPAIGTAGAGAGGLRVTLVTALVILVLVLAGLLFITGHL
jgi:phosphatidylserine/phosphatidylglycerophosphate/cardiolipin synthase-like enzyme